MKHITDPAELMKGRLYWLVDKTGGNARASRYGIDGRFCEQISNIDRGAEAPLSMCR